MVYIADNINYCIDSTFLAEIVLCYPNNRTWVTKNIKAILSDKKRVLLELATERRSIQRHLKLIIKEAKEDYRRKLVWKLQQNKPREV